MREHWSSKLGFILAALGSAIGLGVLWKFPYTVGQNGGGLFLLAYICCILLIGIPVFVAELMLGRAAQRASVGAFDHLSGDKKAWVLGGWLGLISPFLIMSFYSVIAGYGISYILMSLNGFYEGLTALEVRNVYRTLFASADISVLWHFVFTILALLIVLSGVRKGVEYWSKLMMRALFVILIFLVCFNTTLPGFREALAFLFYPDVAKFQFSSLLEALGLAFFTMSLGQGIMISYGSYMRKGDSLPKMAGIVGISVIIMSILAALMVFPVVFSYGFEPAAGPGLIFETLPFLFGKLPGSVALATIFFVLFVFTALTSAVAFVEVISSNLMEIYNWDRKRAVYTACTATFIFGIPSALAGSGLLFGEWDAIYRMNFLDTIDKLVNVWVIPVGGLITSAFVGWRVDAALTKSEFLDGASLTWLFKPWRFFMRYLVPILILLIILQNSGLIDFDKLFSH
ncbi:MAG: sodium-dependent transporter [Simkaniaceae bacterium]|nr:sodium-dependent transporter [Simkaniaceae bacterium]